MIRKKLSHVKAKNLLVPLFSEKKGISLLVSSWKSIYQFISSFSLSQRSANAQGVDITPVLEIHNTALRNMLKGETY